MKVCPFPCIKGQFDGADMNGIFLKGVIRILIRSDHSWLLGLKGSSV